MPNFYEALEFDLPGALTEQLSELFDRMPQGSLDRKTIEEIVEPDAQGVYQLFVNSALVYIGKTDADAGLGKRLSRHSEKVASRRNLDPKSVTFKAVRVFVFTVIDLEQLLIRYYEHRNGPHAKKSGALAWNHSGFGSNDPGRNRDESVVKSDHFDALYPIDLDLSIEVPFAGKQVSLAELVVHLKEVLPYVLRFETIAPKKKTPHADLTSMSITLAQPVDTVRNVLRQVVGALNSDWQLTVMPGYIILYREKNTYVHAMPL